MKTIKNSEKKILSLLLAFLMSIGAVSGSIATVFAAAQKMIVYIIDLPRSGDPSNPSDWGHNSLDLMSGWSIKGEDRFYTVHCQDSFTGKLLYCIEPGVSVYTGDSFEGFDENFWDNYPSDLNQTISPTVVKAYIGRIMQYGYQGNGRTNWRTDNPTHANEMASYIATQLLVWETVVGERDADFNLVDASKYGKDPVKNYLKSSNPLRELIFQRYAEIEDKVKQHTKVPSFMTKSSGSAQTHELKWTGSEYSLTLTDENNVLKNYNFSSNVSGLKFSVSGNQLTISSETAPKEPISITAEKINGQRKGVVVWSDGDIGGGTQDFATYGTTVSDPVYGYMKLEVMTGNMHLVKTSEDGKVEGISFSISGNGYQETKQTGPDGIIDISDMNPGVYQVTELTGEQYEPQETQKVTIVSGQTSTVTFSNTLKRGSLEVTKNSEDGLKEGVQFHLYGTSLSGLAVDEYAVTNSNGIAVFENILISGDTPYTLEEVNTGIQYVVPKAQNISVQWEEATEASFYNVLKKFKLTVKKADAETGTAQGDASLKEAVYGLFNGEELVDTYTTDSNFSFTTKEYVCDTDWTLRELSPSEGYLLDETIYKIPAEPGNFTIEINPISIDVTEEVIKGNIQLIKHIDTPAEEESEPSPRSNAEDLSQEDLESSGNTGVIEQPEAGAKFQVYLTSAGSYDAAKETERDILVTSEDGIAKSKDLPYGEYTVHQIAGTEGHAFVPDFNVFIQEDSKTYSYILNNTTQSSFIRIEKHDQETGKIIPAAGVGFQVRNTDTGELIKQEVYYPTPITIDTFYTNSEGWLMLPQELKYGNYELIEVQTCHGYVLSQEPVPFVVDGSQDVVTVVKSNIAQKGILKIHKTGEAFSSVEESNGLYQPVYTEQGQKGAVFEISAPEDIYTPDGTLRYKAGEVIGTMTTDSSGYAVSEPLYLGKYEIREISVPTGMVDTHKVYEVELTYAGQEIEITQTSMEILNQRQKALVSLEKILEQDERFQIGMNGEATNVIFGLFAAEDLKAADGSLIPADGLMEKVSLSDNGQITFQTDLPFGKFYLQEIATDSHYILDDTKYEFTFSYEDPDIDLVEIKINNGEPIENTLKRGRIEGLKLDEDGNGLAGAVIGLFASDTTEFTEETALLTTTSSEDGSFAFESVPCGNWVVREIAQPTGFVLSEESFPVTVEEDGQIIEIEMTNEFIQGNLILSKFDADFPENKLSGAIFEVFRDSNGNEKLDDEDELLGTMDETFTGVYEMTGIRYGGVFVKEQKAPTGFVLDENAYYIFIDTDGKTYEVENEAGHGFLNQAQKGSLKILKTTSDGAQEGFAFRITGPNGYDQTFTTSSSGEIFIENLRVGEYQITELQNEVSKNYMIADPVTVEIVADETLTVNIHNEKVTVDVPKTGDETPLGLWITLAVLGASGVGGTVLATTIRRKKSHQK